MRSAHKLRGLLVLIVLGAWALRVVDLGSAALIGDEAYYAQWGHHLDWSYYDHPAGIALLVRAGTALAGNSEFGIRWLNALVGTLCVALVAWVGREMLSRSAGVLAAAIVAFGAPYIVTSRFLFTDPLHLLAVLLSLGTCWRLLRRKGHAVRDGIAAGMCLVLLLNTKYTAYLMVSALVGVTLIDYQTTLRRTSLRRSGVVVACVLAIVGLLPVMGWNLAHDFASFRWQLGHLVTASPGSDAGSLLWVLARNLRHAVVYLTWPSALWACLGLTNLKLSRPRSAHRMLSWTALAMLAPVIVSPANSPRNLTTGGVLLVLLAADRVLGSSAATWGWGSVRRVIQVGGVIAVVVYGVGSVAALRTGVPWLPQSSGIMAMRQDAVGWRELSGSGLDGAQTLVAVDYSLAGQLTYYLGASVTTAWPQYRLWGIPSLSDATVVAAGYLPPEIITARLHDAFASVSEPRQVILGGDGDLVRSLVAWDVAGLRVPADQFLDSIDFLTLAEAHE